MARRAGELAGSWAVISALGSFVLYLAGYLSLRFHLTVLGIGTDLNVFDERYLFSGAKFLIYLTTTLPICVLLLLVLFVAVSMISSNLLRGLRFDLTENRLFTLSEGTVNILENLEEPVFGASLPHRGFRLHLDPSPA